ncbi:MULTISPECIES: glycosyltransferase [unclassified Brevibacterium]|uniref:glycosyltransferase n=1 Tax=unclassified Brevibacterium TaxID=2614124 RepID=UPI0010F9973F|nr:MULTISPECIES: glycosyltransferase [unclassified Brevibacterium]MCM1011570.1 glycosyltransferase [Brevibacterium sp. XM4083]
MPLNRLLRRIRRATASSSAPPTRIFDLTWSIPQEYGGLTKVMLRRSRNFVTLLGIDVDVLTLDYRLDVAEARQRLREAGELIDGMRLRNAWDEVAGYDRRALRRFGGRPAAGIPPQHAPGSTNTTDRYIEYFAADGTIDRVDHLRRDGTTFLIDDRTGSTRRLVLLDHDGRCVSEFARARDFYFAWLDAATGGEESILINESKFIATFLHRYKRDHLRIGQVLHNSHLNPGTASVNGPFTRSRIEILRHWFEYDFLVFLTEKQRADFAAAFGSAPTLVVIPNSTAVDEVGHPSPENDSRPPGRGVVLARLTSQKRIDEALAAVARVGPEMTLDIIGDGEKRAELEAIVAGSDVLSSRVTFAGHVDGAAERLRDHSFILLTSSFEGMGVVLIEAMARGCIPLAYDIRYGPSDIIDSGVNGYLVADSTAMADAITGLLDADAAAIADLRRAAVAKAATFSDDSVTARWAELFSRLRTTAKNRPKTIVPALTAAPETAVDGGVRITVEGRAPGEDFAVVLGTRDGSCAFASAVDAQGNAVFSGEELLIVPAGATLDAWWQWTGQDGIHHPRIAVDADAAGDEAADSPGAERRITPYRTVKGNLSFTVG